MNDRLHLGAPAEDTAALTAAILTEEARRESLQEARERQPSLHGGVLPGVSSRKPYLGLREGLKSGGASMLVVVFLLAVMEEVDRLVVVSLAPSIQKAFNISDAVLLGILSFGALAAAVGSLPMAWLAARARRVRLLAVAASFWAVFSVIGGLAVNAFQFFGARMGVALGQSAAHPLHGPLLADRYPIGMRARAFAGQGLGRPVGIVAGSALIGVIAASAAGMEGWRLVIIGVSIPTALLGLAALRFVKEPERSVNERAAVLGTTPPDASNDPPVPVLAAFARLRRVRTFYYLCAGAVAVGFAFISLPTQVSLLLDAEYGYGAFRRGWMISLTWLAALFAVPLAGRVYDKLYRRRPERLPRVAGALICIAGVFLACVLRVEQPAALICLLVVVNGCLAAALVAAGPMISAVAPYRLRAGAFALFAVFFFGVGGFLGGVLTGAISSSHGERMAMSVLGAPMMILAGVLVFYCTRHMRGDMSAAVNEMRLEHEEFKRTRAHPDRVPLLWVHGLDAGYEGSQVLFNVGFSLGRGETLAVIGSNSSGRSTLLRVISGLLLPDRGFVRLGGRNITYLSAETRFRMGIVHLRGGEGVFRSMNVEENLSAAVMRSELERGEIAERRDHVLSIFPFLAERLDSSAGELSGGQQQMLALAMILMHQPSVLIIDELSLGLAPEALSGLLEVLENLKGRGQAMVVVDRSAKNALRLAERALFLEKGHVRFHGTADELRGRSDLLRAAMLDSRSL